jgi:hypothetical protein
VLASLQNGSSVTVFADYSNFKMKMKSGWVSSNVNKRCVSTILNGSATETNLVSGSALDATLSLSTGASFEKFVLIFDVPTGQVADSVIFQPTTVFPADAAKIFPPLFVPIIIEPCTPIVTNGTVTSCDYVN